MTTIMTTELFNSMLVEAIPSLAMHARRHTSSVEDAEDLLQDTMLLILEKEDSYEDNNFGGWAYTLLINILRNNLRRKELIHYCDALPYNSSSSCGAGDESVDIAAAIRAIAPPYRETMELFLAGYKYDEIARMQGISQGTVKSRISRSRDKLQEALRDYRK